MPLINVKLIEDVFTPAQKRQIVGNASPTRWSRSKARTCEASPGSSSRRSHSGDWGIGGKPLSNRGRQGSRCRHRRLASRLRHGRRCSTGQRAFCARCERLRA